MKSLHLDGENILGWYDQDVNEYIPKGVIDISDEDWEYALSICANTYSNGEFYRKDTRTEDEIKEGLSREVRLKRDKLLLDAEASLIRYDSQVRLGIIKEDEAFLMSLLRYMQELRDIPQKDCFPYKTVFPKYPEV